MTDPGLDTPTVTESCTGDASYIADGAANNFTCEFLDGPGSATVNVTADDGDPSNNIGDDPHVVTINKPRLRFVNLTITPPSGQPARRRPMS